MLRDDLQSDIRGLIGKSEKEIEQKKDKTLKKWRSRKEKDIQKMLISGKVSSERQTNEDKMIRRIEDNTNHKVREILEKAYDAAEETISGAFDKALEKSEHALQGGEKNTYMKMQRTMSEAGLKGKRIRWSAERDVISDVMSQGEQTLRNIRDKGEYDGKSYSDILAGLIKEGVLTAGGGNVEILVDEKDKNIVTDKLLKKIASKVGGDVSLTLSDEHVTCSGGVVIRTSDGRIEVDNTFEKRFERISGDVKTDIAKTLFEV